MFQHNLQPEPNSMMTNLSDLFSFLPHLTLLSQIGFSMVAGCGLLYLISKAPEFLLVTAISCIYAVVPLLSTPAHW